jgi:hypothetical protein
VRPPHPNESLLFLWSFLYESDFTPLLDDVLVLGTKFVISEEGLCPLISSTILHRESGDIPARNTC